MKKEENFSIRSLFQISDLPLIIILNSHKLINIGVKWR